MSPACGPGAGPSPAPIPAPHPQEPSGPWAALDPGRSKCGLVCTDAEARWVVAAAVLPPEPCWRRLQRWRAEPGSLAGLVLGDGTGSGPWRERLQELGIRVISVPEAGSTLAARQRYWQLHPPGPLRRLIPEGLRQPPRDWDDVVAQLLLERHLGRRLGRRPDALERV